jgi:tetratricopeptide (TPR) repeat protein
VRRPRRVWRVLCAAAACALAVPAAPIAAQPRSPIIQNRVSLNPAQPVGFDVIVWPDSVYVGQQATYEMGVFISESAQRRMRRNPEVVPAELRGVLAYDLGGPQSLPAIVQNGIRSFPHILQRALFPLADGEVTIPASQLSYSLPRTNSYFSREEAAGVRANALSLQVKPLPSSGKPDAFSGAVGVLSLRARVDVAQARVGDPVVLTVRVGGRGNVKLWPRPMLATSSASLVQAGVRVQVDSTGQYIRGTKEFDWLVTPEREGRITIPVVDYPYFDPYAEEYRVATSDSLTIAVEGGTVTPRFIGDGAASALGLRRDDRGPLAVSLTERPVLWAVLALLPFPAWAVRRRRARREANAGVSAPGLAAHDAAAQRSADALNGQDGTAAQDPLRVAAAALRRRFLTELAIHLDASAAGLVERAALEQRLRRRGVTRETTGRVMALLADLDAAAWSPPNAASPGRSTAENRTSVAHAADASWTDRCDVLTDAVRTEAMGSPRSASATPSKFGRTRADGSKRLAALIAVAGALGWVGSVNVLQARSAAFTDAVALYDAADYADAEHAFLRIAEIAPRHADAWANAGTAAWARRDTVGAVAGWQRALRLEPTAADVRAHLALTGVTAASGIAPVAPRPRTVVAWAAVLLWLAGCMALIWPAVRPLSIAGWGTLAVAAIAAAWQYQQNARLDDPTLAIVTSRQSLRDQPSATATQGSPANTAALVLRGEERTAGDDGEVWVSVTLDAEHAGWLPARDLRPLFGP